MALSAAHLESIIYILSKQLIPKNGVRFIENTAIFRHGKRSPVKMATLTGFGFNSALRHKPAKVLDS